MQRRFLRITKRLLSLKPEVPQQTPEVPPQKNQDPITLKKFELFDYSGHKFSNENKKNYGMYDVQEIWGDRVVFANDKETLKQKRKDTFILLFVVTVMIISVTKKVQNEREMLAASKKALGQIYSDFDK